MNKVVKIIFVVGVFLITNSLVNSKPVTWTRYYDYNNWSNYGRQVIQTFDGGFAFYSETSVSDNSLKKNALLTKTNLYGNVEFNKLITDSTIYGLIPTSFQQTDDSGFVIAGFVYAAGFLIKTDKYGNQQWRRDYTRQGTDVRFNIVRITQDKGYICGGGQYLLKTDSLGNVKWDLVGPVWDILRSNEFYYVTSNGNIFRKLNSNGGIVWEIDTSVAALRILEHPNGFLYLLKGPILSKYDSSGNFYWSKNYFYSFPPSVWFTDLCLTSNNDLALTGYISDPYTIYPDCFLARVDTEGIVKNHRIIQTGKEDYDYLESIVSTNDDGFISFGATTYAGTRLYWNSIAVKTDSAFNTTKIVGITNGHVTTLTDFNLFQNYPNPFNPETKINFTIPKDGKVTLKIYDILGKEVKTLVNEFRNAGSYQFIFNGINLSSGVFYYKIESGSFTQVREDAFDKIIVTYEIKLLTL